MRSLSKAPYKALREFYKEPLAKPLAMVYTELYAKFRAELRAKPLQWVVISVRAQTIPNVIFFVELPYCNCKIKSIALK